MYSINVLYLFVIKCIIITIIYYYYIIIAKHLRTYLT